VVVSHNCDHNNPFLGAWDANTGELLWKRNFIFGNFYGWCAIADGKLYNIETDGDTTAGGQVSYINDEGQLVVQRVPVAPFSCLDLFTGQTIWTIYLTVHQPIIAYGNIYCINNWVSPATAKFVYCIGDTPVPVTDWPGMAGFPDSGSVALDSMGPRYLSFPKWTFKTGDAVTSSPAAANGKVYFGSWDKNLYCVDANAGTLIWKVPFNYYIMSSPYVVGGRLYTGAAEDGYVHCLNADTGTEIWKTAAGGNPRQITGRYYQARSSPIVIGNNLYIGGLDGRVYLLNAANGNVLYTYKTGALIAGTARVSGGICYITSTDGYLYALDATNLSFKWSYKIATNAAGQTGDFAIPCIGQGKVYQYIQNATDGNKMYLAALNATTGAFIQSVVTVTGSGFYYSMAYWNGLIIGPEFWYISAWNATDLTKGTVTQLGRGTAIDIGGLPIGMRVWTQWLGMETENGVSIADDEFSSDNSIDGVTAKVYFGNDAYSITCLDAVRGLPVSVYMAQAQNWGMPAIYNNTVIETSCDGNVYCFANPTTLPSAISASLSKTQVNVNETVTVSGQLYSPTTTYGQLFTPGIRSQPVKVSFGTPSGTRVDVSATTDAKGKFTVTYTPTTAGDWTALAWYNGTTIKQVLTRTLTCTSMVRRCLSRWGHQPLQLLSSSLLQRVEPLILHPEPTLRIRALSL
jgi:outer membrane protein assembly factor BamB